MPLRPELIDELLQDYKNPEDLIGQEGILKQLTKAPDCLTEVGESQWQKGWGEKG